MVVFFDPENPKAIFDHPVLGPILKPYETALFVDRYDKTERKVKSTLRNETDPFTIPVQGMGSVQLLHLIPSGKLEGDPESSRFAVPKTWRNTAARLKAVIGDVKAKVKEDPEGTADALNVFLDGRVVRHENFLSAMRALGIALGNVTYVEDLFEPKAEEVFVDGKKPEQAKEASAEDVTRTIRDALRDVYFVSEIDSADAGTIKDLPFVANSMNAFNEGDTVSRVQSLVKFLAECPHNLLTCDVFVKVLTKLEEEVHAMGANTEIEIYGPEAEGINITGSLESLDLNVLKAVHKGSGNEVGPFMVRIKYRHPEASGQKVHLLAGKSLCFDNGGNIAKGLAGETMQADMMGGASVAAELARIAEEKMAANIDFVFGVASNKADGNARQIGDVFQHSSGETVEERHPDAEGREVLGDVVGAGLRLLNQQGEEPLCVSTVATLTGAAIIMGGHRVMVLGTDKGVNRDLEDESIRNGETVQGTFLDPADVKAMRDTNRAGVKNLGHGKVVPGQRGSQEGQTYIMLAAGIDKVPYVGFDIAAAISKFKYATPKDIQGEMAAEGYLDTLHYHLKSANKRFAKAKKS